MGPRVRRDATALVVSLRLLCLRPRTSFLGGSAIFPSEDPRLPYRFRTQNREMLVSFPF